MRINNHQYLSIYNDIYLYIIIYKHKINERNERNEPLLQVYHKKCIFYKYIIIITPYMIITS